MKQQAKRALMMLSCLFAFWGVAATAQAKTCGKQCWSKKNLKEAQRDCKKYSETNKGPCLIRKNRLCWSGWTTLGVHKKFGANYRACIKKNLGKEHNKQQAEKTCNGYTKSLKRPCRVRKGSSCGTGWTKLRVFGKGSAKYRACRERKPYETLNKISDFLERVRKFLKGK